LRRADATAGCRTTPAARASRGHPPCNGLEGKAARYFAIAARQRKFRHACDLLKAYGAVLIQSANDHLYESYHELGYDPPNIDRSAQAIADEDAATGHEGWDK
jgi:hypothetical protein